MLRTWIKMNDPNEDDLQYLLNIDCQMRIPNDEFEFESNKNLTNLWTERSYTINIEIYRLTST